VSRQGVAATTRDRPAMFENMTGSMFKNLFRSVSAWVILGTQKCLELDDLQTPAAFLTTAL
jgi:hypothetical protein